MTRLRVHLRIYSGRRNPVVDLDEEASAEVLDALAPVRELAESDLGPSPWHLGYRGLRFEQLADPDPRFPAWFEYGADTLTGPGPRHAVAESMTDERLLAPDGPIGRALEADLRDALPDLLAAARAAPRVPSDRDGDGDGDGDGTVTACSAAAPTPDLAWWNDGVLGTRAHQLYNNCYNYGANVRTDTFAQPGRGSGYTLSASSLTADRVRLYAWYDNLYDAPAGNNACPIDGHLVALAVKPALSDYHWWRKNMDGYWTHKPGEDPARAYDASGQLITDPQTCDRWPYTVWVGYMVVVPGRIRLA
jgi:hypothetical protein